MFAFLKKKRNVADLPPSFAQIQIFKNNEKVYTFESTTPDIADKVCDLIQYFQKYDNYQIINDYPKRVIKIFFTVKKAEDVDLPPDTVKTK